MLIKTLEGQIYNLDHAYKLHIGRPTSATLSRMGHGYRHKGDDLFVVQAHFGNEEVDLTQPTSQEEATRCLNRIFLCYPSNIDLSEDS